MSIFEDSVFTHLHANYANSEKTNRNPIKSLYYTIQEPKMKFFEIVQWHYSTLGISSTHQSNQKHPFNGRILFGFLLSLCIFASGLMYIFHVATGFMGYMVGICTLSGHIVIYICFATIIFKRAKVFEIIDRLEKLIDASEPM